MYSTSMVDVATQDCFFDNQQIGLFPIKIIPPEVDVIRVGVTYKINFSVKFNFVVFNGSYIPKNVYDYILI